MIRAILALSLALLTSACMTSDSVVISSGQTFGGSIVLSPIGGEFDGERFVLLLNDDGITYSIAKSEKSEDNLFEKIYVNYYENEYYIFTGVLSSGGQNSIVIQKIDDKYFLLDDDGKGLNKDQLRDLKEFRNNNGYVSYGFPVSSIHDVIDFSKKLKAGVRSGFITKSEYKVEFVE